MRMLGPGKLDRVETRPGQFTWRFTYTSDQHRRVRVHLSTDKRVAEMMSRELVRKRDMKLAGLGMIDGQNERLLDILDKYITDLRSRSTCKAYVDLADAHIRHVVKELKVERVRDLRPHAALELRAKLRASGLAVSTANRYITVLQSMLRWAVTIELIAENPLRNVKRIPENAKNKTLVRRALTEPEIVRLLAAARKDDIEQAERLSALRTI